MFVSMEVITMIGSVVTIIIAMFSGFGWLLNRMDARFAQVDARFAQMDARFAQVDARIVQLDVKFETRATAQDATRDARFDALEAKLDARFDRLDARVSAVEHEVTDVKVAIARLEGPPRHLIPVR
jgi:uncharacterized protein YdcH (DUF465 family)